MIDAGSLDFGEFLDVASSCFGWFLNEVMSILNHFQTSYIGVIFIVVFLFELFLYMLSRWND